MEFARASLVDTLRRFKYANRRIESGMRQCLLQCKRMALGSRDAIEYRFRHAGSREMPQSIALYVRTVLGRQFMCLIYTIHIIHDSLDVVSGINVDRIGLRKLFVGTHESSRYWM